MARKKKSKGLRVSLMLTVGLMIVSFAAGAVACVIGSLIIRQMMVDLVIVHRVVPRNNALLGVGVLVDERVVRGRICAGAGVVGLVDDEIPDLALLSPLIAPQS